MTTLISLNLVPVYIILFVIFRYSFKAINRLYLINTVTTPHPIDAHPAIAKAFFDKNYVINAKHVGYDHKKYYRTFLPVDLIFPLVYTLLFLSLLQVVKQPVLYKSLYVLIIAGGAMDYLEDLSFSWFLSAAKDNLAAVVAFFSSIKTILFITNLLVAIVLLAIFLYKRFVG